MSIFNSFEFNSIQNVLEKFSRRQLLFETSLSLSIQLKFSVWISEKTDLYHETRGKITLQFTEKIWENQKSWNFETSKQILVYVCELSIL